MFKLYTSSNFKKSILVMLAASFAFAISGCERRQPPAIGDNSSAATGPVKIEVVTGAELAEKHYITRFVDKEAGVLCYRIKAASVADSLSCVPLSRTVVRYDGSIVP